MSTDSVCLGAQEFDLSQRDVLGVDLGLLLLMADEDDAASTGCPSHRLGQTCRRPRYLVDHRRDESVSLERLAKRRVISRAEHVVRAQPTRDLEPVRAQVGDGDSRAQGDAGAGEERADAPDPDDDRDVARLEAPAAHRVNGYRHRLGEGCNVCRQPVGAHVEARDRRHSHEWGQPAVALQPHR
jgi:hypothetical protein